MKIKYNTKVIIRSIICTLLFSSLLSGCGTSSGYRSVSEGYLWRRATSTLGVLHYVGTKDNNDYFDYNVVPTEIASYFFHSLTNIDKIEKFKVASGKIPLEERYDLNSKNTYISPPDKSW